MSSAPSGLNSHSSISEPVLSRSSAIPFSVVLFVKSLRLLDLDLLDDWPEITPQTFSTKDSTQNQKARIKATEWALYRLFEIWNPEETKESLNLRGALFRCLSELKKNGILGRDVILRRTMLDDCKGDKFHEVLLVFSSTVLKRELSRNQSRGTHVPPSRKLALANSLTPKQQSSLLPLAVAHKAALSAVLKRKAEQRTRFELLASFLKEKQQALALRQEKNRVQLEDLHNTGVPQESKEDVKRALQNHWVGDLAWLDVLVSGNPGDSSDKDLERPWKDVWHKHLYGKEYNDQEDSVDLLADLQTRVRDQQERLEQWKIIHERTRQLIDQSDAFARKLHARQTTSSASKFDRHLDLNLDTIPGVEENRRLSRTTTPINPKVQAVLTELNESIQKSSTISQRGRKSQDASRGGPLHLPLHGRQNILRPTNGRGHEYVSSGDEPSLTRAHNFRPLPVRTETAPSTRHSTKGLRPLSLVAMSPVKLPGYNQGPSPNSAYERSYSPMRSSSFTSPSEGATPDTRSPASEGVSDYVDARNGSASTGLPPLSRAPTMPPPSSSRPYLSLSERTRLSMAPVGPALSESDESPPAETAPSPDKDKDSYERRHAELLERTRQSMRRASTMHEMVGVGSGNIAHAPTQLGHERSNSRTKSSHGGKRGSVYHFPVNVWEAESPEMEKHKPLPRVLNDVAPVRTGDSGDADGVSTPIKPPPAPKSDNTDRDAEAGSDGGFTAVPPTSTVSRKREVNDGIHGATLSPERPSRTSLSPRGEAFAALTGKSTPRRDATPTELLFSPAAEYASVFKSRPKIATSPIPKPAYDDDDTDGGVD